MKILPTLIAVAALVASAHAQWQTTTYTLKGGWNAIHLHGDATHATPDQLFAAYPDILEVWRWNPNPDQVQFIATPSEPVAGTPEWSVWRRGNPATSTLTLMTGQSGYLVKVTSSVTTLNVPITYTPLPPRTVWVRNGANLLGFPTKQTGSTYPTFSSYFSSFAPATYRQDLQIHRRRAERDQSAPALLHQHRARGPQSGLLV